MTKITPMLATLVDEPFDKEGWIFETKWDGYRTLASKNKKVELLSRNNLSFNHKFPLIAEEIKKLPGSFLIDGEIVITDKKGNAQFQLLQNYQTTKEGTPYYYVFDILTYNGKDVRELPLLERKKLLQKLFSGLKLTHIKLGSFLPTKGRALFKKALKSGLEGIIAKKSDSTYQLRRSSDWLKIKTTLRQEVVIGGFTEPRGSRKKFGALLVGVYDKGALKYVGHVGGGFTQKLLGEIHMRLHKLQRASCPFQNEPTPNAPVTWLQPKLVCEVAFAEWTSEGIMRQPIFKGLREDKPAKQVVREKPKRTPKSKK